MLFDPDLDSFKRLDLGVDPSWAGGEKHVVRS
jgi:hypothetical protein